MDLGPLVTLAVVWAVLSLFGKIAGNAKKQEQQRQQQRQREGVDAPVARRDERVPVRRQPETFEELLAEMRGQIEGKRETPPPIWESAPAEQEEVEDRRTSDDVVPDVVSLETDWQRPQRVETFSDADEAEVLIKRRIDSAAARDHGWRAADHRAFDDEIRKPVVRTIPARQRPNLHQAIIWREVLGPPVSMRPREPLTRGDG